MCIVDDLNAVRSGQPPTPVPAAGHLAFAQPAPVTLPASTANTTGADRKPMRRAKLWELEVKNHCPVIGTCLAMDELGKFANRFSFDCDRRDEFALHVEAVACSGSRNPVSQAIQKHLERKYQIHIIRFERARSDAEVLALWQEHCARGEVAGALWAATTHKAASIATRQRLYADVHMLSHQVGAGQAADTRRLAYLERENADAKAALEKQKRQQAGSEAQLSLQLLKATAELDRLRPARDDLAALQARLATFESGSAMMDMGRKLLSLQAADEELTLAVQRCGVLETALKVAQDEALALARERDQLVAERDALERLLLAGETDESARENCDGMCSSCDHATHIRNVLCVGGRSSLLVQYRALAERLGIRLIHHDGGLEEALSRLPDMIKGADAVMCPTDCVSHNAYYQVKRQCKRSDKPCLLFKGAGISSFAVALAQLSSGRVSLGGALVPVLGH